MARTSFASVTIVDAEGRVVASVGGPGGHEPLEGPGIERVQLPGGGFLITRAASSDDAWTRFSRAFIHEARSPLNALTIYLELLSSRLTPPDPRDRPEAAPQRILAKANEQIRRVEELLRAFGELWGARGEIADLAEIARAGCRFAQHEALRHSIQLTSDICPMAAVACSPGPLADAFIVLLGGALLAPADSRLHVSLALREGEDVVLTVELLAGHSAQIQDLLRPGLDALQLAGGTIETTPRSARATFTLMKAVRAHANE